jgi:exodeoxyribonuclease V gamma subunit
MALHIHRAERTDVLADGLGALLATPPADPFAQDLVMVPARGVERWLSQRLSHVLGRSSGEDGVCAGVSFRSPASLISEIAGTRDEDPWSPDVMTWPLLEVIDASLDEPWCRTLATHLGHFSTDDEQELRQGLGPAPLLVLSVEQRWDQWAENHSKSWGLRHWENSLKATLQIIIKELEFCSI